MRWKMWEKECVLVYLLPQGFECPNRSCFNGDDNGDGPGAQTPCPPVGETTCFDFGFNDTRLHLALPPLMALGNKMAIRPSLEGMRTTEALLERMGFVYEGEVGPDFPEPIR